MKKRIMIVLLAFVLATLTFPGCTTLFFMSANMDEKVDVEIDETNESLSLEASTKEPTIEVDTSAASTEPPIVGATPDEFLISSVAKYSGTPYAVVNNNVPYFTSAEITSSSYEVYADLDSLGRCGITMACIGPDLMPTEERGESGSVKPTGWFTVKYDCVDGKYLYNRCHLIGFQLTGENANTSNLITGTRYMNVDGMLPFENMVADYIKETNNHVMYRVTPIFEGDNLVATGVLMEAMSVEDNGDGILFCVFCYNVQPGVEIDYTTGASKEATAGDSADNFDETPTGALSDDSTVVSTDDSTVASADDSTVASTENSVEQERLYILNNSSKKFHLESCSGLPDENRKDFVGTRSEVIDMGYSPCGRCHP